MTQSKHDFPIPTLPAGKLLIGGAWLDAEDGQTIDVVNPATEQVYTQIAAGSARDVDRAVRAAQGCFESKAWQGMRPLDRGRLLERLALLVEENADELATLEGWDNGKPFPVARHIDVQFTMDALRYYAGWASKAAGEYIALSPFANDGGIYRAYTERRPVGVVAGITPWNFPLGQAVQKIAPAIAFGCTIVLKPSEETSMTALRLGELICEAGFPDGAVNIVTGYGDPVGTSLVDHPLVRKISFTGSTATGQRILAGASSQMKRVTLELGGKSPTIVLADADMDQAIPGAAMAIFANSGQLCTAGSRLIVEDAVYDEVTKGVAEFAKSLPIGHAFTPDVMLGPLISQRQLDKVSGMVSAGVEAGAQVLCGGGRAAGSGYFYQPTVVANVDTDAQLNREEIFGPVVIASKLTGLNQLKAAANDTEYGLGASIWTSDINKAHLLADQIDAGTVWINTHNVLDTAMPFGGMKMSGLGREFGSEAIHAFTEAKAVCMRLDPSKI
ncbi:aldehyde dehydrogenase [Phaeobacter sp. HF9A]|uniref:aldehyde dehydrogenase family protein n=1 Tax=Phaeobacter sp. HF9A TaxID=2721561 RepID=UPI00142FAE8C|nr:aldehyde dehydrogenase family protein [Phaeobacter sp. HF9A]NIZ12077.1 aldehyde dehydrogenase family protein [Phaeobacter sp. HF9A]